MKFIDEVCLEIKAGKGGDGVISFRHESRIEKGGPDGGDGGDGGSIYFQGDSGLNTLLQLHMIKHIYGFDGANGKSKNMYGAKGKDVIVKVPFGTLVYEGEKLICDVIDDNKYLICKGGKGGHGNTRFKSSRNTVPKICENGTLGEKKIVNLELKIMADVGLVGKPNAGKSTLLKMLSNAKPKISDYDFTTLVPQLGLVKSYNNSFVVADLPGLIKGAHEGKGLGIQFLKHIERCKVIAFILDFGSENTYPINDFELLKNELSSYNLNLSKKNFLIVANKNDKKEFNKNYNLFVEKYDDVEIVSISAFYEQNIEQLKDKMYKICSNVQQENNEDYKNDEIEITLKDDFVVHKIHEGLFEISGEKIEEVYQKNPLNTYENILRFNKKVKDMGIWNELIKQGIKNGDIVRIQNYQFQWEDE